MFKFNNLEISSHQIMMQQPTVSGSHHDHLPMSPLSGSHHDHLTMFPVSGSYHDHLPMSPVCGSQHDHLLVFNASFLRIIKFNIEGRIEGCKNNFSIESMHGWNIWPMRANVFDNN